jgi:hypothetical protein
LAVAIGDELGPSDNAAQAGLGFTDVVEGDYGSGPQDDFSMCRGKTPIVSLAPVGVLRAKILAEIALFTKKPELA